MLQKLGLTDLHKAIQNRIEDGTGIRCYDNVELNMPAPFYYVQIVGKRPENTKTMFCEVFTVWLHAIAEESNSSVGVYDLIQKAEEAMTEDVILPKNFELLWQASQGLQTIQKEETNEKHAVIAFDFKVSYGFMIK